MIYASRFVRVIYSSFVVSKTWYRDTPPSLWTGSTRTIGRSSISVAPHTRPGGAACKPPGGAARVSPGSVLLSVKFSPTMSTSMWISFCHATRTRHPFHAALLAFLAVLPAHALTVFPTRVPTLHHRQASLHWSTRLHRWLNKGLLVGTLWHCCVRSVRQSLHHTPAHPVRLLHVLCV